MRRVPLRQINTRVHRERDRRAARLLALLTACGIMLAGGFVYAARQHFAAVRLGYLSEELRREKSLLLEEQGRLLVARERASTPARLEGTARSLGMRPASPAQVGLGSAEREAAAPPRLVPALAVSPAARLSGR